MVSTFKNSPVNYTKYINYVNYIDGVHCDRTKLILKSLSEISNKCKLCDEKLERIEDKIKNLCQIAKVIKSNDTVKNILDDFIEENNMMIENMLSEENSLRVLRKNIEKERRLKFLNEYKNTMHQAYKQKLREEVKQEVRLEFQKHENEIRKEVTAELRKEITDRVREGIQELEQEIFEREFMASKLYAYQGQEQQECQQFQEDSQVAVSNIEDNHVTISNIEDNQTTIPNIIGKRKQDEIIDLTIPKKSSKKQKISTFDNIEQLLQDSYSQKKWIDSCLALQ